MKEINCAKVGIISWTCFRPPPSSPTPANLSFISIGTAASQTRTESRKFTPYVSHSSRVSFCLFHPMCVSLSVSMSHSVYVSHSVCMSHSMYVPRSVCVPFHVSTPLHVRVSLRVCPNLALQNRRMECREMLHWR